MSIAWACDKCHRPIEDGAGSLTLSRSSLGRVEAAWAESKLEIGGLVSLGELLSLPDPAPWLAFHSRCDPDPHCDDCAYHIEIARLRTHQQILWWTAHLMGKTWIERTNWRDLLERLGEAA